MPLPETSDPRVDLLVAIYAEAASRLYMLLDAMTEPASPRRFRLLQQLLGVLRDLEGETDAWSASYIREFLAEADTEVMATLRGAGYAMNVLGDSVDTRTVEMLTAHLTGHLEKARQSVERLAHRVFRSPALEREFPELAHRVQARVGVGVAESAQLPETSSGVAQLLREKFRSGLVSVIGKDGRKHEFPLDYYAGMVAQTTERQAQSAAVLSRAGEAGLDLVRVSPNPSLHGDWCDAYAGRVFSLRGQTPGYALLSSIPPGPPFHPWCKHNLSVFIPDFHTQQEIKAFAKVDQRFLLNPGEESINRVVRNWWSAAREGTLPEPLEFA